MHSEPFFKRFSAYENRHKPPGYCPSQALLTAQQMLDKLNISTNFGIIHVAGTNGKGMTTTMIANMLLKQGFQVGAYLSPHIENINDRIVINNSPISTELLSKYGLSILDCYENLPGKPYLSYFSLLTIIALQAFCKQGISHAVIETGLGGRLDTTNILPKLCAVITKLDYDHLQVLGSTLPQIAAEKLAIVPPQGKVFIAEQRPELMPFITKQLQKINASYHFVRRGKMTTAKGLQVNNLLIEDDFSQNNISKHSLTVPRLQSLALTLAVGEHVLGIARTQLAAMANVLLNTRVLARLEHICEHNLSIDVPAAIIDGGHNPSALQALVTQLKFWGYCDYNLIIGLKDDKLNGQIVPPLKRLLSGAQRIIVLPPTVASNATSENLKHSAVSSTTKDNTADHAQLQRFIASVAANNQPILSANSPQQALCMIEPGRPLVISGSFWMAGAVRKNLHIHT